MSEALTKDQVLERATALLDARKLDEAEPLFLLVLERDAQDGRALAGMANIYARRGKIDWATNSIVRAIRADPDNLAYKRFFVLIAGGQLYKRHNPSLEAAVAACLETDDVDFGHASMLWASALLTEPYFSQLYWRITWRGYLRDHVFPWAANPFEGVKDFRPLRYPLFLLGLRRNVIPSMQFERFMVLLRAFLLTDSERATPKVPRPDFLELVIAVAHYCYQTEYIFETTPSEQSKTDALRRRVEETIDSVDATSVALLAAYMPLNRLAQSKRLLGRFADDLSLTGLLKLQIGDYFELRRRALSVVPLTTVDNEISTKVIEQYEGFPYPRWRELGGAQSVWFESQSKLLSKDGASVLIAGCGTGLESCNLAISFPKSDILAIDLTPMSLAYATERTEAYGISNVTYRHADILKLGPLEQRFDYVQSFGVLHHMEDPEKGWQILTDLLKPGGQMFIGLYSRHARFAVIEAHQAILKGGYQGTEDDMRRFRKNAPKLLSRRSRKMLIRGVDYYLMSMYRDLLFHVHEDCFDIPRIRADLDRLGLTFLGWRLPQEVFKQYNALYPNDPAGTDLENWDAFERAHPETFKACYGFLCMKPA